MKHDPFAWASNDNGARRIHYAVTLFGSRVTPWRRSRDAAVEDAIAEGHASLDRDSETVYWFPATDLVEWHG